MSEEIRSAIALIAGALVLAVCYIKIFLKGRSFNQKFMEKAKKQGCYTTATLIDNKLRLGNDESGNASFKNDRMKCTYDACRIEHTISEESFQKIQELVKKIKKKIHQRNKWKNNGNAIKSVVRSFVR